MRVKFAKTSLGVQAQILDTDYLCRILAKTLSTELGLPEFAFTFPRNPLIVGRQATGEIRVSRQSLIAKWREGSANLVEVLSSSLSEDSTQLLETLDRLRKPVSMIARRRLLRVCIEALPSKKDEHKVTCAFFNLPPHEVSTRYYYKVRLHRDYPVPAQVEITKMPVRLYGSSGRSGNA